MVFDYFSGGEEEGEEELHCRWCHGAKVSAENDGKRRMSGLWIQYCNCLPPLQTVTARILEGVMIVVPALRKNAEVEAGLWKSGITDLPLQRPKFRRSNCSSRCLQCSSPHCCVWVQDCFFKSVLILFKSCYFNLKTEAPFFPFQAPSFPSDLTLFTLLQLAWKPQT